MGPRFNVSSERQLEISVGQPGTRTHTCRDPKHYVHESYALPTELIGRFIQLEPMIIAIKIRQKSHYPIENGVEISKLYLLITGQSQNRQKFPGRV